MNKTLVRTPDPETVLHATLAWFMRELIRAILRVLIRRLLR